MPPSSRGRPIACKTTAEVLAPVDIETTIRRLERRYTHIARFQVRNPRSVRPKSWPTRAAERKDDGIGLHRALAFRRGKPQNPRSFVTPANPLMPHMEPYARLT